MSGDGGHGLEFAKLWTAYTISASEARSRSSPCRSRRSCCSAPDRPRLGRLVAARLLAPVPASLHGGVWIDRLPR